VTETLRLMKFSGIPVLFIPGNSGSHKQGKHGPLSNHMCCYFNVEVIHKVYKLNFYL
jgi:hypothetical protein